MPDASWIGYPLIFLGASSFLGGVWMCDISPINKIIYSVIGVAVTVCLVLRAQKRWTIPLISFGKMTGKTKISALKQFIEKKIGQLSRLAIKSPDGKHTHDVAGTKAWYDQVHEAIRTALVGDRWLREFELHSTLAGSTAVRLQRMTYPAPDAVNRNCTACSQIVDVGYMLSRMRDGIAEPDLQQSFTQDHIAEWNANDPYAPRSNRALAAIVIAVIVLLGLTIWAARMRIENTAATHSAASPVQTYVITPGHPAIIPEDALFPKKSSAVTPAPNTPTTASVLQPSDINMFINLKTLQRDKSTAINLSSKDLKKFVIDIHNDSAGIDAENPIVILEVGHCEITSLQTLVTESGCNWIPMEHPSDRGSMMFRCLNKSASIPSDVPFDFPPLRLECEKGIPTFEAGLWFTAKGLRRINWPFVINYFP